MQQIQKWFLSVSAFYLNGNVSIIGCHLFIYFYLLAVHFEAKTSKIKMLSFYEKQMKWPFGLCGACNFVCTPALLQKKKRLMEQLWQ